MKEPNNLSKRDLFFLAHVLSGSVKLKPVEAMRSSETSQIVIGERSALQSLQDNCELLDELLELIETQQEKAYVSDDLSDPSNRV